MMGILASSVLPLLYELAIETAYPLKAGLATGFLWLCANIAGTVWTSVYLGLKTDFYPSFNMTRVETHFNQQYDNLGDYKACLPINDTSINDKNYQEILKS